MTAAYAFSKEEMAIDPNLGYPRVYAKLCKDTSVNPYTRGPPFSFTPYNLNSHEISRANELDEIFPIVDPEAKPTSKNRIFVGILWKQLNHLGNAGFDPAMFRVDPYGNVLYFHADSASPLAWAIDHWFPCSRGGLTIPSNLRILQWQVCKRKHNQLEFLVPWWDLQLGISINQFLSIFAASNSDFRHRAFRLLFSAGENEELNDLQTVDSHNFPQPYLESKEQLGRAPAAIVRSKRDYSDISSSTLRSVDINRQPRPSTPIIAAARKFKNSDLKENEMPDMATNPYQAIVMARDSLKQRDETKKMKAEIQKLDDEVIELKLKNEKEKLTIQELELALIKRKRRAEKCRKLAEAQSSHKAVLEKMIRDAMHQNVVYREQVRLNQAATNSLMARLEVQMAICNSAEKELCKKYKQRDELEKQIRPEGEQARKRSRTEDGALTEEKEDRTLIYLPRIRSKKHLHKELRVYLEEEQKLSEAAHSLIDENKREEDIEEPLRLTLGQDVTEEHDETDNAGEGKIGTPKDLNIRFPFVQDSEVEEDEESRKNRGKGNVEKWLQILLDDAVEGEDLSPKQAEKPEINKTDEIIKMLNEKYPQKEIKVLQLPESAQEIHEQAVETEASKQRSMSTPRRSNSNVSRDRESDNEKRKETLETEAKRRRSISTPRRSISSEAGVIGKGIEARKSFGVGKEKWDTISKDKGIARCESARSLRHFPSSPSMILNMRKGVDCIRKKPLVLDDEEDYIDKNETVGKNFLKSPFKTIKKAVKI